MRAARGFGMTMTAAGLITLTLPVMANDMAESAGLPVAVLSVTEQSCYRDERAFLGRVEPVHSAALGFEVAGRVATIEADLGDAVTKDAPLATLDTTRLEVAVRERQAQLDSLNAQLTLATRTLNRAKSLAAESAASKQRLDEASQQKASLEAQIEGAIAALERARRDVADATLRAPFDGTVTARHISPGDVVAPGQAALAFQSHAREIRVGLPATYGHDYMGHGATVQFGQGDRAVRKNARIDSVVERADQGTNTVTAVLEPHGTTGWGAVPPTAGQKALVLLHDDVEEQGFWVPLDALTEGIRGLWSLYALMPNGDGTMTVQRHAVTIKHLRSDSAYVSGTPRGTLDIVGGGLHRVVPGQIVVANEAGALSWTPPAATCLQDSTL